MSGIFDENIEQIIAKYIEELQELAKTHLDLPSIPSDRDRMKNELTHLVSTIYKFPKMNSYILEEIYEILDDMEFSIIKSSPVFLHKALQILEEYKILPGIFIDQLGILDLREQTDVESLSLMEIDQRACLGVNAIETPSIFMNHVYKHSQCPFCKEPVKVGQIQIFILLDDLKSGLTFRILKKGDRGTFHFRN